MFIQQVVNEFFPEASLLASGCNGSVFALSQNIAVKGVEDVMFWQIADKSYQPIDKLAMQWANKYNNLVVKFKDYIHIKDEEDDDDLAHLIIMERVFPCIVTAFTTAELQAAILVAEAQLNELWESGWAHCDLKRPIKYVGNDSLHLFNNIVLTEINGKCVIRLIDVGDANLEQYDENDEIEEHIAKDQADWEEFKLWLLDYPR